MRYIIEQPSIDDALELSRMHHHSWLETYPNDDLGISKEYIENWSEWRVSEDGIRQREAAIQLSRDSLTYFLRIARDESSNIVGFIDGHHDNNTYWLDGLYTLSRTYGTGLGQQLWETYLPWTDNHDILLTVATYNERAKAFYKKIGFTEKAGTERMFAETPIPVIDMIRKV